MKKNKFMRLASCLLVGTLLTTCAISGTFAKYTTQDAANDSARVAKWGVELQIIGSLYGDAYNYNNGTDDDFKDDVPVIYNQNESTVSVHAADTKNVVAPGTKSDTPFRFKLNGTPEVDTQILATIKTENVFLAQGTYGIMVAVAANTVTEQNFSKIGDLYTAEQITPGTGNAYVKYTKADVFQAGADYFTLEDVVKVTDDYYPVVYSYDSALANGDDVNTNADDTDENTLATIAKTIADKLAGTGGTVTDIMDDEDADAGYPDNDAYTVGYRVVSKIYDTNTDLTTLGLGNESISWEWNFTDKAKVDGDEVFAGIDDPFEQNQVDEDDGADTILGNLGATDEDVIVVQYQAPGVYNTNLIDGTTYNLDTSFSLDITVNQVD